MGMQVMIMSKVYDIGWPVVVASERCSFLAWIGLDSWCFAFVLVRYPATIVM